MFIDLIGLWCAVQNLSISIFSSLVSESILRTIEGIFERLPKKLNMML